MLDFSFDSSLLSNGVSDVSSVDTNESLSPGSNISYVDSPEPPPRDINKRCRVIWLNTTHVIYGCCACEESFLAPRLLERHLGQAHPWLSSTCVCPECGRRFLHSGHVKRHRRECHDLDGEQQARQHVCELCDKRFKRAEHLRVHERTMHARSLDFACAICNRAFGSRSHVLRHQRGVHRDLRCIHCGKTFARSSSLTKHQRVCRAAAKGPEVMHPPAQVDILELYCEQCGKAFSRISGLTRHQAVCRKATAPVLVEPAEGQVVAEFEVDETGVALNCEEDDWIKLLMLQ